MNQFMDRTVEMERKHAEILKMMAVENGKNNHCQQEITRLTEELSASRVTKAEQHAQRQKNT